LPTRRAVSLEDTTFDPPLFSLGSTREHRMIYREPGFLSALRTPPSPGSKFLSLPVGCRSSLLTEEGGRGWARSEKALALYKTFNTLWTVLTSMFCLASSISFFFSSKTTWKRSRIATTTCPAAFSVLMPKNLRKWKTSLFVVLGIVYDSL
jgi:hypothetical protein